MKTMFLKPMLFSILVIGLLLMAISAFGGEDGNTLDGAYDQGGAGAGRAINADAGAVNIAGPDGLTVEGNVGIGTTRPGAKLAVGTSTTPQAGVTSAIIRNGLELNGEYPLLDIAGTGASNTLWRIFEQSDGRLDIGEGGTPAVGITLLKTSHNVGIGTTRPGYSLHVVGKIYSTTEVQGGSASVQPGNLDSIQVSRRCQRYPDYLRHNRETCPNYPSRTSACWQV